MESRGEEICSGAGSLAGVRRERDCADVGVELLVGACAGTSLEQTTRNVKDCVGGRRRRRMEIDDG